MPIIKSAIKKMRQDKRRTEVNKPMKTLIKTRIDEVVQNPTKENVRLAFKTVDKAVKKNLLHKNRANRLKSRMSGLLGKTETKTKHKSS